MNALFILLSQRKENNEADDFCSFLSAWFINDRTLVAVGFAEFTGTCGVRCRIDHCLETSVTCRYAAFATEVV
jgi:hypothetical protein